MKSVIKYQINEIVESLGYDSKTGSMVPQKEAKMNVVYTSDPNDPRSGNLKTAGNYGVGTRWKM